MEGSIVGERKGRIDRAGSKHGMTITSFFGNISLAELLFNFGMDARGRGGG